MAPGNVLKSTREKPKDRKTVGVEKRNKYDTALEAKRNLKIKRDALNASREKKKEELSKLKEDDPEYEKLKAEVDANGDTVMEYDNQMQALDADMDLDDEDGTTEQFFVAPGASGDSQSNPTDIDTHSGGTGTEASPISVDSGGTDTGASPVSVDSGGRGMAASPMSIDDDEEETDVLTREIYNKATGQDTDGKVIGWRKAGWGKQAVVQYGPRNAALYKLLPTSSAPDFDETATPCITDHRPGEEKDPVTKKWKRTQKDVAALQGVAVHFDGDNPKNNGLTWLDLIDPERYSNDDRLRFPNAICKVKWADGTKPSFETRTTIRRLWSKSKGAGDQALSMVGKENQRRYDEWKSGQRAEEDKSPTPNPAIENLREEDAEGRAGSTLSGNSSQRSTPLSSVGDTPAPPSTSGKPAPPPASSTSAPKKAKRTEAQFQESWLKRNQLSGDDLEPGQEAAMMDAYDAYLVM